VDGWLLIARQAGNHGAFTAPRASVQVVSPVEQAPAQEADRTDKLILVLEDEADVRQTLCEQLHGLGI
jgi:hypothetical protein